MNYIEKYKEMEKLCPTINLLDFIDKEFGRDAVHELLNSTVGEISIIEALACKYGENNYEKYLPKDEDEYYKLFEYGWTLENGFKLINLYEYYM